MKHGFVHEDSPIKLEPLYINSAKIWRGIYFDNNNTSVYEGLPGSNANSCVISFIIAIFQDSFHQSYDA